ncbi:MAG: hypothetical protein Aureis2KO_24430 [Aureisphaera sp.]
MKQIAKIPAFTLTEMMVGMALSTVVIGLAYMIMSLMGRNVSAIQDNYSTTTQIDLLEQQMTVDFNHYHDIAYDPIEQVLKLKTPIDSITYTFLDKAILRKTDTILSQDMEPTLFWQGTEVVMGAVDGLKLEWGSEEKKSFLFLYQEIDAARYMTANGN